MIVTGINKSSKSMGFPKDILIWIALAIILTLGHYLNNKSIILFSLIIIMICFLLVNLPQKIKLLYFFIPWIHILRLEPGIRSYFSYLTIILLVSVVIKSKFSLDMKKFLFFMFITIFILLQKLIIGKPLGIDEISFLIPLATFCFIKQAWYKSIKWDEIALAFVFGLFLAIISGHILNGLPHMQEYFRLSYSVKGAGIGLRFSGLYFDPNGFSALAVFGYCLCTLLFVQKKLKFSKSITGLIVIIGTVIFIAGFLSGSKAYLFITVLNICLYLILSLYEKKALRILKVVVVFTIIIVIGYFSGYLEPIIIRYLARFSDSADLNTLSSGRFGILQIYLQTFIDKPWILIFGTHPNTVGLDFASHNTIIQSLFRLGLINSVILLLFFKNIFKTINNRTFYHPLDKNLTALRCMPFFSYMLFALSLDQLYKSEFFYIVYLSIYILDSRNV